MTDKPEPMEINKDENIPQPNDKMEDAKRALREKVNA
jgi:hypothetical protein